MPHTVEERTQAVYVYHTSKEKGKYDTQLIQHT